MKITDVTFDFFEWDRPTPISNGLHTYDRAGMAIISIATDDGVVGHGIGGLRKNEQASREMYVEHLIGADPMQTERIWSRLFSPKRHGRRGMEMRAQSSIDIALWDIKAKVAGLPLAQMIGGYHDAVNCYMAGGYYAASKGLKELEAEMTAYVEAGARAVKMKIGAVPMAEDRARVQAVRRAIGPEIKLMVDANCAYRAYEAIQFASMIEEYDIFWFEEPVQPDDYEGYVKIAEKTSIPLAGGENEYTKHGFRDLIATRAVPIIQADGTNCGGVTEFMKIAGYAQAHGLDIAPHGEQQIHIHLLGAIPNGLYLEYYPETFDPMRKKKYAGPLLMNTDGTVSVPRSPGAGLTPDWDFLERYRL